MNKKVHFLLHYVIKVLSSESILHDDKDHFGGFDDFVHLGDGRVSCNFEEVKFSGDTLNIRCVFDF